MKTVKLYNGNYDLIEFTKYIDYGDNTVQLELSMKNSEMIPYVYPFELEVEEAKEIVELLQQFINESVTKKEN